MTPAWNWTRFDALRERLRNCRETKYPVLARLRGRVADARHALENGQPVTMTHETPCDEITVVTPDAFVDAWEQGWRP